jgi:hypothetical protein
MRRLLALIAVLAFVAGCTSHKTATDSGATITTSGSDQSKSVTVTNGQSTATAGKNVVDPASLGLPLYPGVDPEQTTGYENRTKQGDTKFLVMATTDPFDTVEAWYKARLPQGSETQHMSAPNSKLAHFDESDDGGQAVRSVQISWTGAETSIMLTLDTKS